MSSTLTDPRETALVPLAADRPGDDPIFALNAQALKRARDGEDVLNATLGALMDDSGHLALMPSVSEAISRVDPEQAAAYAPISGDPPYRRAVVRDTFGDSPLVEQSISVATAGATGALLHAVTSFLEPGQALLTTSYFWSPYQIIASHTQRAVELFDMFDASGAFDTRSFEKGLAGLLARQGRALVLFNFPCHNPTGYSLDDEEWGRVAEIVERHAKKGRIAFLIDFAYAHFGAETSKSWVRHAERIARSAQLLVAWTASKAFAQYGARVGALIATHEDASERQRLSNALGYACRGTWSNCNHLGLLAITQLLEDPALAARSIAERKKLVALLDERVAAFNEHASRAELRYPRYEGGFFVSVFTPDAELTAARMRERGVFVVPMKGAVRAALCSTPAAAVPRLVAALVEGVSAARAAGGA